jgi:hypothetical protein
MNTTSEISELYWSKKRKISELHWSKKRKEATKSEKGAVKNAIQKRNQIQKQIWLGFYMY